MSYLPDHQDQENYQHCCYYFSYYHYLYQPNMVDYYYFLFEYLNKRSESAATRRTDSSGVPARGETVIRYDMEAETLGCLVCDAAEVGLLTAADSAETGQGALVVTRTQVFPTRHWKLPRR